MANIQRAVLVETPPSAAYRLWKDFERYPSFFEGVKAIEAAGPSAFTWHSSLDGGEGSWAMTVLEDDAPRRLRWTNAGGRERECLVTLSALEGNACWMVLNVEFDTGGLDGDLAEVLALAERRVQRTLFNAREVIEAAFREDPNGCTMA